ncbi:MAG: hypothetical protein HZA93_21410 [Verrucomicrobia bacterium]|nr:hypothetical protein [Verrucomicrobiota bacterium]
MTRLLRIAVAAGLGGLQLAAQVTVRVTTNLETGKTETQVSGSIGSLSPPPARMWDVMPPPLPPARLPIFYSPEPPALGAVVDRIAPLLVPSWNAPAELAPFVGEPFYTPLASRLAERNLSNSERRRLETYRTRRDEAVRELRSWLAAATARPPEPGSGAALEPEAEALRLLLFSDESAWGRFRDYRVNFTSNEADAALMKWRQFQFLRAAASDEPGLSSAQRRLLAELIIELNGPGTVANLPVPRAKPRAVVFFFPETARVTIPPGLPPAFVAEFDRFLLRKHELKREIAAELLRQDGETDAKRKRALTVLAVRHEPLVAELEACAESIRAGLVPFQPPGAPSFSAAVLQLAARHRDRRQQLQAQFIARLQALRTELLSYAPGAEDLRWLWLGPQGTYVASTQPFDFFAAPASVGETDQQVIRPKFVGDRIKAFADRFAADTAGEAAALESLRRELFAQAAFELGLVATPDTELDPATAAQVAVELKKVEFRHRLGQSVDYETAVLRPGLHAANRRLLFNHAVVSLALPLPVAIRRPVGRFE